MYPHSACKKNMNNIFLPNCLGFPRNLLTVALFWTNMYSLLFSKILSDGNLSSVASLFLITGFDS